MVRDQEVEGSNPFTPTCPKLLSRRSLATCRTSAVRVLFPKRKTVNTVLASTYRENRTCRSSTHPCQSTATTVRPAKLSSMAPEFQPMIVPPVTQSDTFNVRHHCVDESSFPDHQIENLVIVVRGPGTAGPTQSRSPVSPSSHSFSSGSVDGYEAAGGTVIPPSRSPFAIHGLRSFSEKWVLPRLKSWHRSFLLTSLVG